MSDYQGVVTKETVILDKPSDWIKWLFLRKDTANKNDIWKYCNPDLEQVPDVEAEKPKERSLRSFKKNSSLGNTASQQDIEADELTREEREDYQFWLQVNAGKKANYEKTVKALAEFNREISRTIASRHIYTIQDDETPHARLRSLKKILCLSVVEREYELLERYEKVKKAPRRGDLDAWFDEYINILKEMGKAKLPEMTGTRAQKDFLRVIQGIDETWASGELRSLIDKEMDGQSYSSGVQLVERFQRYRRTMKPVASSLGTYATLGGSNQDSRDKRAFQCPCGEEHLFKACPYVVKELRDAKWKPDPKIEAKFKNIRQKGKANKLARALWAVEHSKDSGKATTTQSATTDLDNSDPPANVMNSNNAITWNGMREAADETLSLTLSNNAIRGPPPLINKWILDPGSNLHVANHRPKSWKKIRDGNPEELLAAGTQHLQIEEWGSVELTVETPRGDELVNITWVAYIPSFLTSVVSLSRCRTVGFEFDSGRSCLYRRDQRKAVFCNLQESDGHWVLDSRRIGRPDPVSLYAFATQARNSVKPSRDARKPLQVTAAEAHEVLAHANRRAIDHLETAVEGIQIIDGPEAPRWKECEDCIHAKLMQMISRRPLREPATRPFERISVDLIQLRKTGEACYNGDKWLIHFVDQYTKWHEARSLRNKDKATLTKTVVEVLAILRNEYKATVVYVKLDNERGFSDLWVIFKAEGIKVEPRVVGAPQMTGMIEKAGHIIVTYARAMKSQSNLPKDLTNELCLTAVYLLNRTPTEDLGWKTPYEVLRQIKPTLAHLAVIGSKALFRNIHVAQGDKLESRAIIGWLVGFEGTNIFRVWMPGSKRVIRTRDVVLLKGQRYKPEVHVPPTQEEAQLITILDIDSDIEEEELAEQQLLQEAAPRPTQYDTTATDQENQGRGGEEAEKQLQSEAAGLPTPRETPTIDTESSPKTIGSQIQGEESLIIDSIEAMDEHDALPRGWYQLDPGVEAPNRRQNNAPRRTEPQIDQSNIIQGSRRRGGDTSQFSSHAALYFQCFAAAIAKPEDKHEQLRLHRDDLLPPPKTWKEAIERPDGDKWKEAADREVDQCMEKDVFERVATNEVDPIAETLPLMWVFAYKFDADGYLSSYKARLVVRGDLQTDWDNTYAATLAARTLRFLITIMCAFGLLAYQYDIKNAFLNVLLNRLCYVYAPEGYIDRLGHVIRLQRALYGLKDAPALWYNHLKRSLLDMGFTPVKGIPCLFTNGRLILFYYVDDIVVLARPTDVELHRQFERVFTKLYNVRCLGDLKWFLGIRIVRDVVNGKAWMLQDSYITKVVKDYDLLRDNKHPKVPIRESHLAPSTEPPNAERTKLFQILVGCLGFISYFTRPDVAKAHSILARHLQNPGQKHLSVAKTVWQYLYDFRFWAIGATTAPSENANYIFKWNDQGKTSEPLFFGASDAAFADEPETSRSSYGFMFKLYGMPIDWKAKVMRSVTKSTTEAELAALSVAGSEMRWWMNTFESIGFNPEVRSTLYCDNQQTVSIVNKDEDKLNTKLRHVKVHQNWVREQVAQGTLNVIWISTAEMPADGLTKSLSDPQKHLRFLQQLGMMDIKSRVIGLDESCKKE